MPALIASTVLLVYTSAMWTWFGSTRYEFMVVIVPFTTVIIVLWLVWIWTLEPKDTPWSPKEPDYTKDRVSTEYSLYYTSNLVI